MVDSLQFLLIVVVSVLTTLLGLVGIQSFLILKEFKKSIEKLNKILDDMGVISESIAKPVSSISPLIKEFSEIIGLFGWLLTKIKKDQKKKEEDE